MLQRALDMIAFEGAANAAFRPVWSEHEVLDDQLAPPVEQLRQGDPAGGAVKGIALVDPHPWQLATLCVQSVAGLGEGLLLREQLLTRLGPLFMRDDLMLHSFTS